MAVETVAELVALIGAGEVSARSLASRALERLDAVADLNGVAWRHDSHVLATADELDRAYAETGPIGPLHGIPVSIKDWIDATPFPCAAGQPEHADRRPARDATVVARLRAAGAIVIAKSTIGPTTTLNGTPRNPFDRQRTPGYSSAGEAISVALGASAFGIGSDSGGSVRFPAHCCGLVGLRPTFGRVPVTGHFPRVGPMADGRTVIGPLTRTVGDLRIVFPVIAGPDGRDPSCPPVASSPEPTVRGLRIAVHRQPLDGSLRPDVGIVLDRAAAALEHAGCIITDAEVLDVEHSLDITRRYWTRARLGAVDVETLLADWDHSRVRAMRLLDRFDAILSPAAPFPAPLVSDVGPDRDHHANDHANWTFMLAPSLWGWPAVAVPAGLSEEGLPLGVQIVAGPWNEGTCIALAALIEADGSAPD